MTLKKKGRLSSRMTSSFNLKPKKKGSYKCWYLFFSNLFFFHVLHAFVLFFWLSFFFFLSLVIFFRRLKC